MKTEDLINLLSTNVEPADPRQVARDLTKAVIVGLALSVGAVLAWSGTRSDLADTHAMTFMALKVLLAAAIVLLGARYLLQLGRPGTDAKILHGNIGWHAYLIFALAVAAMVALPLAHWHHLGMTDGWLECIVSIPIIAIIPFASVGWAMRRMAPTNLPRTGAVTGMVAGGISALGYALHCTDDTVAFIAVWYGGAIALCALAGFLLGPRLLRW